MYTAAIINEGEEEEVMEENKEKEVEKDIVEENETKIDKKIDEKGNKSKSVKNKEYVNNKRRNFSTPIIPNGNEIELSGTFNNFNQWHSKKGIQKNNYNSKRFKHNHDSK